MATIEKRGNSYRVDFRFGGIRRRASLETTSEREALSMLATLKDTLRLVERGVLRIPENENPVEFLVSGGQPNSEAVIPTPATPVTSKVLRLKDLLAQFFNSLPANSHESSTISGMRIHERQLLRILGKNFLIGSIAAADLQRYVNFRSKEKNRWGEPVTQATIRKALTTLRTVWNWGIRNKLVAGQFPIRGLEYPKAKERPRFRTWEEIEKAISLSKLGERQASELWECLFLTVLEVNAVLKFVRASGRHDFVYPLFVFVAHTGARRSEMLRSERIDFDFAANLVTIRERKKTHLRTTTRQVPMSGLLRQAMIEWFSKNPGARLTFDLPSSEWGGKESKVNGEFSLLTAYAAHHHFKRALEGSKWRKIRGFHVFRHSFASNLAAAGIDDRVIDELMGHQTEEMRRRYRHLLPGQRIGAIETLFPSSSTG